MQLLLEIQKKLIPDAIQMMQKRYQVLQYIRIMQPIGRRSLANQLAITERVLRSEVDFLKDQGLIDVTASGMVLTFEGNRLLDQLEEVMKEVQGLKVLENRLKEILNLEEVIIVSGDSDYDSIVKQEMGRATVAQMKKRLRKNDIVAVTGGTSLVAVADMMTPEFKGLNISFVPARGGLGENVDNQANTICAKMADKAKGDYRMLHVPDQVSDETYASMMGEPSIQEVLALIKAPNMVVHGIGDAKTMAERRKTKPEDLKAIIEKEAVGEAFGYYFDHKGTIIHKVRTMGIQLEDLKTIECVIAVAGGASKARAIEAYMKLNHDTVLITDEGAANALIREHTL